MKIKIVHFVPGFDHGGIESRLIDWYKNINRNKYQFDLVVYTDIKNNKLIEEFIKLGGRVFQISPFSFKNIYIFKKQLKEIFESHTYQVAHCHSPTTGLYFLKEAKKAGVKTRIMHSRTNMFSSDTTHRIIRNILKSNITSYANVNLACSNSAGKWLFKEKEFQVIENGIETDKFKYDKNTRVLMRNKYKIAEDEIILGSVSRLTPVKNHFFMLDVIEYLNKENSQKFKLFILGDGPLKSEITKKINEKKLNNFVYILGRKENVYTYYQMMDIYLFPSEHEGFGTVAIEAQTAGLKTLVSDGVPKEVDVTDLVVRLKASEGLKEWVEKINENIIYNRRDRSLEVASKCFDVSSAVQKLSEIYKS